MQYNITDEAILQLSIQNRILGVERSQQCGCFCCGAVFPANIVVDYVDDNRTALCPRCNIDSVLPDAWIELSRELLVEVGKRWFAEAKKEPKE